MPRTRGRNTNQATSINEPNDVRTSIKFNYSENFNRVVELNTENYNRWRTKILHLLSINNIIAYITKEKVKKLRKKDIQGDLSEYIEDEFDDTLVYDKNTSIIDINNDITTKWIILNSLGEKTQDIIQGANKTAFELWKILKRSFTKNINTRKLELKNKLDNLKYNTDIDINIFIADLQNIFDELEKIDNDIESNIKAGILNRSLPEELRWINVFQFKDDWNKCSEYVMNM